MPSYYRDPDAPAPNLPRRVGVMAIVERAGRILVERRADDPEWWAFLGGGLDEDEGALDALRRELREETGFTIADATLVGVFTDPERIIEYPDGSICRLVSLAFRVVPVESGDPTLSDESREMRFVTPDELAGLDLWPVHVPVREALLERAHEIVVA
jgi:8-oxo-dGTP pyrophosphatase MutT (NUDIX family)